MMVKRLIYKIYTDDMDIRQKTTSVNVSNITDYRIYDYATSVILERFPKHSVKFNHVGKTIKLTPYNNGA